MVYRFRELHYLKVKFSIVSFLPKFTFLGIWFCTWMQSVWILFYFQYLILLLYWIFKSWIVLCLLCNGIQVQIIALLNGQNFLCFFLPKFIFALEFYFQYLFLYVLILCIIWQAAIYWVQINTKCSKILYIVFLFFNQLI